MAVPWAVILGFIRLMTHPSVLLNPLDPATAVERVASWLQVAHVEILIPGPRHLETLGRLLSGLGTAANLTSDAHLAALALASNAEIHSNDADFQRFPRLRWHNPLN